MLPESLKDENEEIWITEERGWMKCHLRHLLTAEIVQGQPAAVPHLPGTVNSSRNDDWRNTRSVMEIVMEI